MKIFSGIIAPLVFALLFIGNTGNVRAQTNPSPWITTYHPTWWYSVLTPAMIDFSSMTHITIFHARDAMTTAPYFNSAGIDDGKDFPQIVQMAHAKGVKVLISVVGGYGQTVMPQIAADPVKCQAFVDAACAFALSKNADGIELDWEFPRAADDVGWNRLIRLFRKKLDTWSTRGILATSMFYSIGGTNDPPFYRDSMMVFDQINLMTYTMWMGSSSGQLQAGFDTPVHQPTAYPGYKGWALSNPANGPLTYLHAGYPASKIGIGMSFEGTRFDGVTSPGQEYSGWGFTSSVTNSLSPGYAGIPVAGRVWDPVAQANYCVNGSTVYSFQDTNSVKAISVWANNNNFGGVMIYDLGTGYDKIAPVPDQLLKTAARSFRGTTTGALPVLPSGTLSVAPTSLPAGGGTVNITWTSSSARTAIIDQGIGSVPLNGVRSVAVTGGKTFTLTLTNDNGSRSYTAAVTVANPPAAGDGTLYSDGGLRLPWTDLRTWGIIAEYNNTSSVYNGTSSLKIVHSPWGSLQFSQGTWGAFASIDPSLSSAFEFAMHGGTNGVTVQVSCLDAANKNLRTPVTVSAPPNTWVRHSIPMNTLAVSPFTAIAITAAGQAVTFFLDDIRCTPKAAIPAVPVIVYPVHNSTGLPTEVKVQWKRSAGAATYHLQISKDPGFTSVIVDQNAIPDSIFILRGLIRGEKYYLRIRSANSAGVSEFSSTVLFTTAFQPDVVIYKESSLNSPWRDVRSWGVVRKYASILPVYSGTTAIGVAHSSWGSLQFTQGTWGAFLPFDPSAYYGISFAVHGGNKGVTLTINCQDAAGKVVGSSVTVSAAAMRWTPVTIPFSRLTRTPFIALAMSAGAGPSDYSLDDIVILSSSAGNALEIAVASSVVKEFSSASRTVVLRWSPAPNAALYRIHASASPRFDEGSIHEMIVPDTSVTITSFPSKFSYWRIRAENETDTGDFSETQVIAPSGSLLHQSPREELLPGEYALHQNYPNPFNPTTTIRYGLPEASRVTITIYSILGQKITELIDREHSAGWYSVEWNAKMASGMYLCKIVAVSSSDPQRTFTQMRRMMLLK